VQQQAYTQHDAVAARWPFDWRGGNDEVKTVVCRQKKRRRSRRRHVTRAFADATPGTVDISTTNMTTAAAAITAAMTAVITSATITTTGAVDITTTTTITTAVIEVVVVAGDVRGKCGDCLNAQSIEESSKRNGGATHAQRRAASKRSVDGRVQTPQRSAAVTTIVAVTLSHRRRSRRRSRRRRRRRRVTDVVRPIVRHESVVQHTGARVA
jgi:hypothetical protein